MSTGFKIMFAALGAISLLSLLLFDTYLNTRNRVTYFLNFAHVNLYYIPMSISLICYSLFFITSEYRISLIAIILILAMTYLIIANNHKVILRNADFLDVVEKMNDYLTELDKPFKLTKRSDDVISVELNNFRDAITIRDCHQWVEITRIIRQDQKFISETREYFREKAPEIKCRKTYPDIYFIYVFIAIVAVTAILINFAF